MGALFASLRLDGGRFDGGAELVCQPFAATPEEAGESQPLADPSGRFALLFDGRLDNREELGIGAEESDAASVLRFLSNGKWDVLDRFIGPWALLLLDLREREVHLARDPTGERMLCWHADSARILVASEPAALPFGDFDEETLAAFFAVREPAPDATFFRNVKQVPAGCRLTLPGEQLHRFWNPDLSLLRGSEADSVEAFRDRLSTAVRAQLRVIGPPTVLMSGGLDSTTVAAHAARYWRGGKLRAVSWRFHELTEADESEFAQAMMTAAGLEPVWVDGDGCWPLRDRSAADPSQPFENPYRELHAAAFSAAAQGGARALLTGHFSDEMYHGIDAWWLRDCLAQGRWGAARRGLRDELRWGSRPEVWTPGLRRALGALLLGPAWERLRALRTPSWLIPAARKTLRQRQPPVHHPAGRHPEQAQTLLAPFAMMGIAAEMRRARQHGVELRFPFRDRRLIELALRLPADHLARPGWRKRLVWLAGEGWLPDEVRLRRRMSDLGPLFARGIGEHEHETVRSLLFGEGPQLWRRWVDPAMLERFLDTARTGGSGLPTLVFWRCLAAELWARSHQK